MLDIPLTDSVAIENKLHKYKLQAAAFIIWSKKSNCERAHGTYAKYSHYIAKLTRYGNSVANTI